MLLLIPAMRRSAAMRRSTLHSTMLLLIPILFTPFIHNLLLYIPLCFYLYEINVKHAKVTIIFTFHYASTYTKPWNMFRWHWANFTFHYASTYTIHLYRCGHAVFDFTFHYASTYTSVWNGAAVKKTPLHSTMLLLIQRAPVFSTATLLPLHSTMLLLILRQQFPMMIDVITLHSTMLLLILVLISSLYLYYFLSTNCPPPFLKQITHKK